MGAQPTQLWLPALARFDRAHPLHRLLSQADRLADDPRSRLACLADAFHADATTLPVAALIREQLAGDAGEANWLNADPAWVQPDMTGVRLLACGSMSLAMDEAQAFAGELQPAFAGLGLRLEVGAPNQWQVRLAPDAHLPDFATPEQALGEDLYQHLPQGAEGRPWRMLLNEVQVLLHLLSPGRRPVQVMRCRRGS